MKRKEAVYKGLEYINVYFQDASSTSPDYFQISEFPLRLTAGKNLFKLRGHPTNLKVGGSLNIEVLDYNGNPIYTEVIDYIDEDKSRVIAIYIYEDTSPGDCIVTLLAEAAVINGSPAPAEWQGRANVKWSRSVPVNPNISNVSEIIFDTPPELIVTELIGVQLDRIYSGSIQFPTYTTGTVRYFTYNNQPAIEIQGGKFTSDMSTGIITVASPVNPIPTPNFPISTTVYSSTIKKILNPTTALLDTEYIAFSSQSISSHKYDSFDASSFSLYYEQSPTYIETQNSESFAYIQVKDLDPATGDVSRIKVFTNNNGTVGIWELINDVELEETEIFVPSTASLYPDQSIGIFATQSIVDTYWEGISYNGVTTAIAPTLTWTTASIENGMLITNAINLDASSSVSIAQIKSAYAGVFLENSSYKVTLDAIGTQSGSTQPTLAIYLSGSSFYQDPTDYFNQTFPKRLGKRIGQLSVDGTTQRFDDQTFSFDANYNGTGTLLLVVESGTWTVSDIHVTSDNDPGYSPNYTRIKSFVPTTHKLDNQISFKVEYYNVNGEKSKQTSYVYNKDWEGGNRYIDGNYSMLTGSLYVADSLESGIGISGYPNSGFVRSLGYQGFDSGFAGFLLWSGSALPGQTSKGQPYSGVGLELYANTSSYFRYSTSNSEIDVRTDKFFFGNPSSSYISGSNGLIQISSSNFLLSSSGDVYANDGIFSGTALANVITNKMITITTANSSSYLQTFNLAGTSPTQTSYRIRLDGALGGELGIYVRINCQLLYPIGPVILPSNPIGGAGQSTFTILNDQPSNQIYDLFLDKSVTPPPAYDIIDITDGAVLNFVKVSGNNYSFGGTETPTPYTFRRTLNVGDGDSQGGTVTLRRDSNLTASPQFLTYLTLYNSSASSAGDTYNIGMAGNSSTTTALGVNDPYFGITKGTANQAEVFIAFSGSGDGNTRRTMINSGVNYPYTEISSNYSVSLNDYFITATNTSGTTVVTLPTGSRAETGRVLEFKYRQTGGTFEIDPSGTDTIDGVASKTTTQINSAMKVVCNGLGRWNVMYTTGSWT
jgi:hypothetical protein